MRVIEDCLWLRNGFYSEREFVMTLVQSQIVDKNTVRDLLTSMFGGCFGNHPGSSIEETRTVAGELLRIEIKFTRCWEYRDGVFQSRFGHIPDGTCNYDWMGVSLRENRRCFVMSVEIVCDSSDMRYKIRVVHYWRPVHSIFGLLRSHFRGPWYFLPWRVLSVLFMDFKTGLKSEFMSMGQFDSHILALEAVRAPNIQAMPEALRKMLGT